jgi:MFS family permease
VVVERWRLRRRMGVLAITAARVVVLCGAVLPFLPDRSAALSALLVFQALISVLVATGSCAVNSWFHQLIPREELGRFFSRRLFWGTALACAGTLGAGALIDLVKGAGDLRGYAIAFVLSALAGFASSGCLAAAPEPVMQDSGPAVDLRARLLAPFRDRGFRRLIIFLAAWTIASSLAVPFLTVYLIEQRGYTLSVVTTFWVASQIASALTLYLWGRLSDRLSNKAVLAVALPVHFACILAMVFIDSVHDAQWQIGLLYVIHVVLGIAGGGIGLATGNLGLKLAPSDQATSYLAAIGIASAVAGGLAPVLAGWLSGLFKAAELSAVVRWAAPGVAGEVALVSFAHWEFVFALSALLGLYVMHALSRIDEGREVSERQVVQAFALEAWQSLNSLSSLAGSLGSLFPFDRLAERRKWWRTRLSRRGG